MPETDQQQPAADDQMTDQQSETDESIDWKAKAREWEKRAKQNTARIAELEPKAKQYDALEAASKTELERAQEQAQALQRELETTQRASLISSVALDKGLPANLARRLQGDTREELEADADELLSQFQASQQSSDPRPPRPDLSQGSSASRGSATSPAQEFAALIQNQTGR